MSHTHMGSLMDIIHWSRTLCFWDPFQTFGNASDIRNLFMRLGWLWPTCVTGTWVTSWIDVILVWYHYIVISTLVPIFNWWLSSKDMKLRVLIKEVLAVFHWLTFRIIYIYIYIYIIYIYIYIMYIYIYYIYIYIYKI